MSEIEIRPYRPDDAERYMAIRNLLAGDRARATVEEHHHFVDTMPERAQLGAVVAERGVAVGFASWSRRIYTTEEDTFWLDILVDRDHWGTGVGRALYRYAIAGLDALGAKKIYASVREDVPRAEAFAARRGFARTGHGDRISRLDVKTANLEKSRAAAQHVEASGIRITTLAELDLDDDLLEALRQLDYETARDIPGEEDYIALPPNEFKAWLQAPGILPEAFWLAMDGEKPIGMAPLQIRADGFADNYYTAVGRDYRGQGIARALKLRGIEWARENGIHSLVTGNDPANKPMLAVNMELGYQMLPANIQLAKTLA